MSVRDIKKFLRYVEVDTVAVAKDSRSPNAGFNFFKLNTESRNNIQFKQIQDLNKLGHDCYFLVHNELKARNVKNPRFLFVDLDAGRNSKGKYKQAREVNRFKARAEKKINEFCDLFCLDPSLVVETRNGFQLYWKLNGETISINRWQNIQNKIYSFFKDVGADPLVLKPNQILRLPFTFWNKRYEGNYKKFLCKIREDLSIRYEYSFNDFISALDNIKISDKRSAYKKNSNLNKGSDYWRDYWGKNNMGAAPYNPRVKRATWKKAEPQNTAVVTNHNTVKSAINFLNDISRVLNEQEYQYFAYQARSLSEALRKEFT